MIPVHRFAVFASLLLAGACAGSVYFPGDPGAPDSDLSGVDTREEWLEAHPDTPDSIAQAIRQGVFVEGMTVEHRDVVTNSDRRGTKGNGYWRSRDLGDEVRYHWYVSEVRDPFDDGRGRAVCELVYQDERLDEVRYCSGVEDLPNG